MENWKTGWSTPFRAICLAPLRWAALASPWKRPSCWRPPTPPRLWPSAKTTLTTSTPEEPEVFLKPPSAILNPGEDIVYPIGAQRVDYEAEIAVIVKKKARYVKKEEVMDYIFGLTLLNDVSRRDKAKTTTQWVNGKGYDTFCPIGPWITTVDSLSGITIRSHLNGELRQNATIEDMIFGIPEIFEFVTNRMTLMPGDVIATGTPSGVAPMQVGDVIVISSDELGELKNQVVAEVPR